MTLPWIEPQGVITLDENAARRIDHRSLLQLPGNDL